MTGEVKRETSGWDRELTSGIVDWTITFKIIERHREYSSLQRVRSINVTRLIQIPNQRCLGPRCTVGEFRRVKHGAHINQDGLRGTIRYRRCA